jgi:hypothetical protein
MWLAVAGIFAVAARTGSVAWFGIGVLAVVAQVVSLYFWPFAACWRCKGTGRNQGSSDRRWGECRRCKGGGRRRRVGARALHRGAVALAERRRKGGS